jgi:HK97 family phage portal protein
MGLVDRVRESRNEQRTIGGALWKPWDNPFTKFSSGGPLHPAQSTYGADQGLSLVPLYACVRLIAEYISSLPLKIYVKTPDGHQRRWEGPTIFDDPAPSTNIMDWLYEALTSLLLHGNAWGYILGRDGYGFPTQIQWMPPEMVTVIDEQTGPFNPLRSRVYFYGRRVSREEYFHIKAFSLPGRTEGISPLRAFAMTIMNGIEATRYGTDWFKAGGFPPGTFKNNEIEINPDDASEIRAMLNTSIRRREPLVYGRDWDYHPVTVPPSEAQFIEAMQMNATQLAAVYGLPPDRVGGKRGDSMTYSTVQQGALQIIEALRPWMVRLETAFFTILPQRRFARFNADALLKTDLAERAAIYKTWREIGFESVDAMRDTEDMAPLPNGIGADNIPLEAVVAMARSTRAIPNSLLPQVTLEQRLLYEYLQALAAGAEPSGLPPGLGAPAGPGAGNAPPSVDVPGAIGANVNATGAPGGGFQPPNVLQQIVKDMLSVRSAEDGEYGVPPAVLAKIVAAVRQAERDEALGPEFVGPWIPPNAAHNGHNGSNGRGHPERSENG